MAHLIVGNDDCSYYAVAAAFETPAAKPNLSQNWEQLGRQLNVAPDILNKLRADVRRNEISDSSALIDILIRWRNQKAKNATLLNLLEAVDSMLWHEISTTLRKEFCLEDSKSDTTNSALGSSEKTKNLAAKANVIFVKQNSKEFKLLFDTVYDESSWTGINVWKDLGVELGVNDNELEVMRKDILHDKIKIKDAVREILKMWVTQEGDDATVQAIREKLLKIKWKNTADKLVVAFKL